MLIEFLFDIDYIHRYYLMNHVDSSGHKIYSFSGWFNLLISMYLVQYIIAAD